MKVLVTGSQGFIGSYICADMLAHGYDVIGVDNFSKYGKVSRPSDNNPNFSLIEDDVYHLNEFPDVDYVIAGAAMIGGISYFHKYAYDLLATNERIIANTFDMALKLFRRGILKRILVMSSSMVFENTDQFPTKEDDLLSCPPPSSTYGFQKLACEYFCKGAYEQYGLPYSIVRPFNCVGVGEEESKNKEKTLIGNLKMMMSHVLPDIVNRAIELGPDMPLPILGNGNQIRHYTNGRDVASGIRAVMESDKAENDSFNISSPHGHTVKELASIVYNELYGISDIQFEYCNPFEYDVQIRQPDVTKARNILGIECNIPIRESVREVIEWIRNCNID